MIKVLVVDDSSLMRGMISDILESDKNIKVIGSASSGLDAIKQIKELSPDVVTLDIKLPDISGLDVLNEINLQKLYVPVVVISAYVKQESFEALQSYEYGAVDVIEKPSGSVSLDIKKIKERIIDSVRMASRVDARRLFIEIRKKTEKAITHSKKKILIIGASTGGPQSILKIFSELPGNIPIPIIVVQHLPGKFTSIFAKRLNTYSKIRVKELENNEILEKGRAYVVPGDYNLDLEERNYNLYAKLEKREGKELNSINRAVESATKIYGSAVLAVILTGMGEDGKIAVHELKRKGGEIICQDETSCVVYGMSREIIENKDANFILPLDKISGKIIELLNK